jgi:hypothetical protein
MMIGMNGEEDGELKTQNTTAVICLVSVKVVNEFKVQRRRI